MAFMFYSSANILCWGTENLKLIVRVLFSILRHPDITQEIYRLLLRGSQIFRGLKRIYELLYTIVDIIILYKYMTCRWALTQGRVRCDGEACGDSFFSWRFFRVYFLHSGQQNISYPGKAPGMSHYYLRQWNSKGEGTVGKKSALG